jgi:histidine phosphotransferase ChpT
MYNKNPQVASLLSSRICHDLVSPLGAIGNGLELLELSGTPRTAEFDLMASSIQNANAKIDFFRIAYGPAGSQDIAFVDIERTLSKLYSETRYTVSWQITDSIGRSEAKLYFLIIQCLENALPRGGTISVTQDALNTHLVAEGPKTNPCEDNWEHLLGKKEKLDITASEIHFELVRDTLEEMSKTISVSFDDTTVKVTL